MINRLSTRFLIFCPQVPERGYVMGVSRVEFGPGELRIVGGDYGQLVFEGVTQEACRALDTIVAGTRSGDRQPRCNLVVDIDDIAPPELEVRHAGREGTPEAGVGADPVELVSSGAQSALAAGTEQRETEDSP